MVLSFMVPTNTGVKKFWAILQMVVVGFWGGGGYLSNPVDAHIYKMQVYVFHYSEIF